MINDRLTKLTNKSHFGQNNRDRIYLIYWH